MRSGSLLLAALVGSVALSFAALSFQFELLFSANAAAQMWDYAVSFFPPDLSGAYLARVATGTVETLAISAMGTLVAALAGLLLALPGSGRWGAWLRPPARFTLNVLRSIPELVWAALLVLAAGLGPFAGTLALAAHTAGVLGRLFAETLENAPDEAARALHEGGVAPTLAFLYGTLPTVLPQFIAYTLYRWENNIRMAAVLGFVGAGGLGQMLYFSLSLFQNQQALTVIAAMLLIVAVVDVASAWLRGRFVK